MKNGTRQATPPERPEKARPDKLGVLGGMGPLATADFLTKLMAMTPAQSDLDHIPLVVSSEPQIPSRGDALMDPANAPSPLAALKARVDFLVQGGARCLAMPCNTAHYWYDEMTAGLDIPFLHIVDAVIQSLNDGGHQGATVGLFGTRATIEGKLYETPLVENGFKCLLPADDILNGLVLPGIDLVKRNRIADARPMLQHAVERILDAGADVAILGCTEIPVGLDMNDPWTGRHTVDPTGALARACLDWATEVRQKAGI